MLLENLNLAWNWRMWLTEFSCSYLTSAFLSSFCSSPVAPSRAISACRRVPPPLRCALPPTAVCPPPRRWAIRLTTHPHGNHLFTPYKLYSS
jgi:hypothetical protein